jgi:ABC-2 type transport system ATP-binding protein
VLDRRIALLAPHHRRRLGVAQALLSDAPLLLLDEPTEGLDPQHRDAVHDVIRSAAPEKAILIAANRPDDVEALCGRVVVIVRGRVLADAAPVELARRSRYHNAVRLTLPAGVDTAAITAELARLPAIRSIEQVNDAAGGGWRLFPWGGRPITAEIGRFAQQRGWPVEALRAERGRLDDVVGALADGTGDDGAALRRAA